MGDAGDRIAQHAALTEDNQEEFPNAVVNVVGTIFAPGFCEERDQLAYAETEENECCQKEKHKNCCADPSSSWRDHGGRHTNTSCQGRKQSRP